METERILSGRPLDAWTEKAEYVVAVPVSRLSSVPTQHMTLAYLGHRTKAEIDDIAHFILKDVGLPNAFEVQFNGYSMLGEHHDIRVRDCLIPDPNAARFAAAIHEHFGVKQPFQEVKSERHPLHVTMKTADIERRLSAFNDFMVTSVFIKQVGENNRPYVFPLKNKKTT